MNLCGQFIGIIAIIMSFFIYQQSKRKNMVICKLITDLLWAVHFFMIGSNTAMATTTAAIFREIVFYNNDKKWGKCIIWIFVFSIVFLLCAVLTWKDMYSLLPAITSVITTIGFWIKIPERIKLAIIPASIGMFIYNINYMSIAGIINEILALLSIISYFIKKYIERKRINADI